MSMKFQTKKIPVAYFINVLLVVVLIAVVGFGWFYLKGRSPVETIAKVVAPEVPNPKYLYSIYGPENKRLRSPYKTFVTENRIYIADSYNSRIVVTDYNGKFLSSFGKKGNHVGAMLAPMDVIIVEDEIFVVDVDLGGVEVWDMNGKFKRILGNLKFSRPVSIAFMNNKFYVLDVGTMKVNILDRNGKLIKNFGKQGNQKDEFYYFYGMEARNNQLYIADSNNNRIQIYDENGQFIKTLKGQDEKGADGFSIPRGVAFDVQGNMYTVEMLGNQVTICNSEGVRISGFSYAEPERENVTDQIGVPTNVFIDDNNRLYVTELGKSRVLVYQI